MDLLTPFRVSTLLDTYESSSDDISSNTAFHTNHQVCQKGGFYCCSFAMLINFVMLVYYSYHINVKYQNHNLRSVAFNCVKIQG